MKLDQTILQEINFGEERSDIYYCLVDQNVSPDGLNVDKMRLTDPRNIDLQFREAGCLIMMTGDEVDELINRGDLLVENLHQSLFELAVREGIIKKRD
tara:strand:- start:1427 stop:1720 length:294 start_codon:yes stop_codon:yes gene_type:complete